MTPSDAEYEEFFANEQENKNLETVENFEILTAIKSCPTGYLRDKRANCKKIRGKKLG